MSDAESERVLELAEEFLERYRKGERPSLREYIDRHPELAAEIKDVFPAMAMMENIAVADDSLTPQAQGRASLGLQAELQQLGDYRIIREIGYGGMGVVYEAEQISLGRHVALKVLPHKAMANEKTRKRFEREARAAAKLHHTNIVPVFAVGEHEGMPYYAMQFIQGLSMDVVLEELKRFKKSGGDMGQVASLPMTGPAAGSFRRDISAVAMARSMVTGQFEADAPSPEADSTRDGEPAPLSPVPLNKHPKSSETSEVYPEREGKKSPSSLSAAADTLVLSASSISLPGQSVTTHASQATKKTYWHSVAQTGVQVADALEYAHKQGVIHRDIKPSNLLLDTRGTIWVTDFGLAKADDRQDLTHAGDILGTLRYMPPEAFEGRADGRGDVYALGLTLYELLAFRPAFDEKDQKRLIKKVTTEEPPRLGRVNRKVPRDLVNIVHKAIARDPAHRYQTPAELGDDLKRFGEDRPVRARRVTEAERLWRWCRRNPLPASLVACIVLVFLTGFAGMFWQWRAAETARDLEKNHRNRAEGLMQAAETARDEADQARAAAETSRDEAEQARAAAEKSRLAAEAETCRAVFSELKMLRAVRESGWRQKALDGLARLAVMPTPPDLTDLRSEAAAVLATPDIRAAGKVQLPSNDLGSFTFSPDGRTIFTVGTQKGLDLWDADGNTLVASVDGLTVNQTGGDKVLCLPDGQGLLVGTREHGVVFTDMKGVRTPRAPITQGKTEPTRLALDAAGKRIAVSWTDGAGITVHDLANGAVIEKFKDSSAPFALHPDCRWLARSENSDIVLLPIASAEPRVVLGRHDGALALAFSADGTLLAVAFSDHTTVIWNVAKREAITTLHGHRERVLDVAFSPDGEWIATGALDYTARVWNTRTGQSIVTLPSAPVRRLQWSPTGAYMAISTVHSGRDVYLYKVTGRRHVQQWLTGHTIELLCVAANPRLDRLATSGYTELNSWDLSVPRPARIAMPPNTGAVTALAFSPDGALLATACWLGGNPREILIRDAETGRVRTQLTWPQIVNALAFDPAGEHLACGDLAGGVAVWDLATRQPINKKFSTDANIRAIVYLDRPRSLVTNGKETLYVFDLAAGTERKVDLHSGEIRTLAADQAASRLVVGFQNGTLASFSLPDLTPGPRLEKAHDGSVVCVAFSPDGRLLATGGGDHRVVLRDAQSLESLLAFPPLTEELRNLTFDNRGRRLAIVGSSSDVDLWDLSVLRDDLTALGLAWNRPAPALVPAAVGPLRP